MEIVALNNDSILNDIRSLIYQFIDLLKLKKCMHNWFNFDTDLLKQIKLDINDKYLINVIKQHFNEFKTNFWDNFKNNNLDLLQNKYPNTIQDLIYDPSKKYFYTIKNEFIEWLKINHYKVISEKYNESTKLFLDKINELTVHDKKLTKLELTLTINLIKDKYIYMLREHIPISDRDIKNIECVIKEYENYIK
jgi:hypothetical protein